jgi:hypothetical protein
MDEKFWLKIWAMIITAVVIILSSFTGCTMYTNHCTLIAIEKGVSPQQAQRAFSCTATTPSDAQLLAETFMKYKATEK